jgi:hypothetical protein
LKLLIDENLSPRLARWACESGVPAEAVVHVGDFITLAAGVDLHPGVITLKEAELSAALQWERLNTALAFAEKTCNGDLINRVLEVQEGGQCLLHAIPPEHVN